MAVNAAAATMDIQKGATLSLDDCINIALANDPGYESIKYDADAAQARTTQALSAYLPALALQGGFPN